MKAYQIIRDSMGGSGPIPLVYLDKRAAEMWASANHQEWASYKVEEVELRELNDFEGAVGGQLVFICRDDSVTIIRDRALKKLTAEERSVLGLPNPDAG
jgi:hypothetical protein